MSDIAKELNISTNTVSVALRNKSGVSSATREWIIKTATDMGYLSASNITTPNILIVSDYAANLQNDQFAHALFAQLDIDLRNSLCNTMVEYNINSCAPAFLEEIIYSKKINGIIIIDEIDINLVKVIADMGIPFITSGTYYPTVPGDSVMDDNINAMVLIGNHLAENGYTQIGFIGPYNLNKSFAERWMGFNYSMKLYSLSIHNDWMHVDAMYSDYCNVDFIAEKVFSDSLPEVFVCMNDRIGVTCVKALAKLGIRVPDDIGVIGFDNSDFAKLCIPTLTTIQNSQILQSQELVRKLLDRIKNPQKVPGRSVSPIEIVIGDSTRKLDPRSSQKLVIDTKTE